MDDNNDKNFVSVVLLSFPSQLQYDLWYENTIHSILQRQLIF